MGGIPIFSNEFWALLWAVNTILAFYVVFHRKRSVATSWAWLIILLIFPILGFILYGFIGRGLSQENLFAINNQKHIGLNKVNKMIPHDPCGSPGASKTLFKPLTDLGGEVVAFITAQNMIKKYRMNYHLHRKIVVIDGRISWTGGFNVGDQYVSKSKKFGYWRDTHLRIVGSASLLLQERFVMDWNASITDKNQTISFNEKLFPKIEENQLTEDDVATQIVSDGPDTSTPYLRNGMIRMMMMARKTLWIQTPYLVPDDPMIATWVIAAHSGVDVRIMIPSMPDHPFIYRATQWYTNYLLREGIKIYVYDNGFIHAKTVMVDDRFAAVGSMNQDFRSYSLNFETDAVFYDKNITRELNHIFEKDLAKCTELTLEITDNWSRYLRFKQAFSRLLSPIL